MKLLVLRVSAFFSVFILLTVYASCGKKEVVSPDGIPLVVTETPPVVEAKQLRLTLYRTLVGHHQYVFYLDFNKSGNRLASGAADRSVRLWDYKTGKELFCRFEQYGAIWGIPVHFSPNNRYLVIGAHETLKVLYSDSLREERAQLAHSRGIQSLHVSPDSRNVLTAGVDGKLIVWSVPELEKKTELQAHNKEVWNVCISPDGNLALSGGQDSLAKIWSFPDLNLRHQIDFHRMPIEYVRFSDDGKFFLLASADSTVSVWRTNNLSEPYRVLRGHLGSVLVAKFSPDSRYIFSGGDDNEIYVFDIEKGDIVTRVKDHWSHIMSLSVSPDGKFLASGSRDRTIKIWSITFE